MGIWISRKWKWNENWKRKIKTEIGNGNVNAPLCLSREVTVALLLISRDRKELRRAQLIDYRVVKLNDSLFLFCDMDASGAFYKATGKDRHHGVSQLLTVQPPIAINWVSSLIMCFLCFGYMLV